MKTIEAPGYLTGPLRERYDLLAPTLCAMGTLDELSAELLAKYVLAENEYLRVSTLLQNALGRGDGEDTNRWLAAQDKLTKQILALGEELGITPRARKARGLIIPR